MSTAAPFSEHDTTYSSPLIPSKAVPVASGQVASRRLMFIIEALTVGGAERMVIDIANALAARGDDVHVVCLTAPGDLSNGLDASVHFHVLDKKPGIDISIVGKIRRLVTSLKIDVVNTHLWTANTWTRFALSRSGIPVVVTEHNRDIWKKAHHRAIDRMLSHAMCRLIAVSEDTASFYIAQQQAEHFVSLLGTRSDIPDLLAALDVFVLSSDREGHPLSALESQAAGTPVVLTDAGGSADAVSRDGDACGGVLVQRTSTALAEALRELLQDPNRLVDMAAFARRHASDCFDKSTMVDQYSAIFDACRAPH